MGDVNISDLISENPSVSLSNWKLDLSQEVLSVFF